MEAIDLTANPAGDGWKFSSSYIATEVTLGLHITESWNSLGQKDLKDHPFPSNFCEMVKVCFAAFIPLNSGDPQWELLE